MTAQEQGKFILLQVQRKQPINCVYADGGRECNTVKSSITILAYLFYLITAHKQSHHVVVRVLIIEAAIQNDKLEYLLKMYYYTRPSSSDNSMSDKAEREEIREEAHELEDAEQDELEEDDDDYDEDETDQNT